MIEKLDFYTYKVVREFRTDYDVLISVTANQLDTSAPGLKLELKGNLIPLSKRDLRSLIYVLTELEKEVDRAGRAV